MGILHGCGFSSGLYNDILQAQEYVKSQNYEKAVVAYENILIKKPSKQIQLKVDIQLGEIYSIYLNQYQKALKHYENVLKTTEDPLWQVRALEKMGEINFENLKDFTNAYNAYNKLISFSPPLKNVEFYKFRYAESLFYLKEYVQSEKLLRELAGVGNSEYAIQSYYYLGLIKFYQEKWEDANNEWFEYLKREKRKDRIVQTKFLIANAYESAENLKSAYNIYYSIVGEYPNPEIIKQRLKSLYARRVARKR